MEAKRRSGILLHISSLPSVHGIGDFGDEAYRFIDQMASNGFSWWQILPLGPVGPGDSPYQAFSAYAGEPLFISLEKLIQWDLLNNEDIVVNVLISGTKVDYKKVRTIKEPLIKLAWKNFQDHADDNFKHEFLHFQQEHNWWLTDYALYTVCKEKFESLPWNKWDKKLAERKSQAVQAALNLYNEEILYVKFIQFLFFRQWFQLKAYANQKGIQLFGDLPLYVSHDSADVWGNQKLFLLDENGEPKLMGGVPPDYFSEDGQLWGNPVFNWNRLKQTNYQWWISRLYFNFHLFNMVRIDHFRGLESFWAVPHGSDTAKNGTWMPAYGAEMLQILQTQLGHLPVIAEDLGIITPEVDQLRDQFMLPGMKVLQFAYTSDETNVHLPHNYQGPNVVYTGTHDNNTLGGWLSELSSEEKKTIDLYFPNCTNRGEEQFLELVWGSSAGLAIVPFQDLIRLNGKGRMNVPGTATGNWTWRYKHSMVKSKHWDYFKKLNTIYNRHNG
ncbi:MAG: 4-alpha-glucanotransferase [Prolixibacteraceae bacterium]